MWPASWPSTVRTSAASSTSTVRELITTIGRPEPIAAALVTGNCVRYSSGSSAMSSRASAARCAAHTSGSWSEPSLTEPARNTWRSARS